MDKICKKCKVEKEIFQFSKSKKGRLGVRAYCKICQKEYRNENIFKIQEYRRLNKDKKDEYNKLWYKNNKEKRIEYLKVNKDKINEYRRERRVTDPLYKLICNIRKRISTSITKQGFSKKSKTYEILGCSYEDFKIHIEKQFTKGMSWISQGEWHIDHIIPISSAKTEEEVIKLNHYTNLRPLWAIDNQQKSNKYEKILSG